MYTCYKVQIWKVNVIVLPIFAFYFSSQTVFSFKLFIYINLLTWDLSRFISIKKRYLSLKHTHLLLFLLFLYFLIY